MADAEATGDAGVPAGEAFHGRLVRLEEALRGVRSMLGVMQWAGAFVLTVVVLMVGALLTRSFTVGDQIAELTAVSRETGTKVTLLQEGAAEAKADLREFRAEVKAELRDVRVELTAMRASFSDELAATRNSFRDELAAMRVSLERVAATVEALRRANDDGPIGGGRSGATAVPPEEGERLPRR